MYAPPPRLDALECAARLRDIVRGSRLTAVECEGVAWRFAFGPDWDVRTDTWRLITGGRIAASADDHGHMFGLSAPFDAAARATTALIAPVTDLGIAADTADLAICFGADRLEFLNTSCGYESWILTVHAAAHPGFLVAQGGGTLEGTI